MDLYQSKAIDTGDTRRLIVKAALQSNKLGNTQALLVARVTMVKHPTVNVFDRGYSQQNPKHHSNRCVRQFGERAVLEERL